MRARRRSGFVRLSCSRWRSLIWRAIAPSITDGATANHLERGRAAMEGAGEVDRNDPLPVQSISLQHLDDAKDSGGVDPELQGCRFGCGALGKREHRGAI